MIRPADNRDIQKIIQLIDETYQEYGDSICLERADKDLTDIEKEYLNPGGRFWVFEKDGDIIGTVAVVPAKENQTAALKRLYLKKEYHGTGIGDELLQKAMDWARHYGVKILIFWSDTRFERGHRFYVKHGFVRKGVREMDDGNMPYSEYYFEKRLFSSV